MKLLRKVSLILLLCSAVIAHAENKDAQVKPLMDKITAALKADRASEALPYMAQLEGMELDLSYPLPESFYYYYIDTLDKTGDKDKALSRGKMYLKKYGQNGKHYSQVSEIVNKLQTEPPLLPSRIVGLWDSYYNQSKDQDPTKIWIDDSGTLRIQKVNRSSGTPWREYTNVRIVNNRLLCHDSDSDGEQYDRDLMLINPSTIKGTINSSRRGVAQSELRRIE